MIRENQTSEKGKQIFEVKGFWQFKKQKEMLHRHLFLSELGENSDGIVALHLPEQLGQVTYCPVRVPAGDPLQHCFQRALTVLHRVGVSDPGGGEGAVRRQMFGVLHAVGFWIQQNHQLFQNIQVVQHCLQRRCQDVGSCRRKVCCYNALLCLVCFSQAIYLIRNSSHCGLECCSLS